jgi:Rod binding domain-containing protein
MATDTGALRGVARDLEASFIAEMLQHAGFGESRGAFGGGAGEDQFASMLRSEHAQALAEAGGIGLAESIFHALVARRRDGGGTIP